MLGIQPRKSAEELLGISSPQKSAEELLGVQPKPPATVLPQDRQTFSSRPRLGFENKTGITPTPLTPPTFGENVKIGAERGYRKYLEPAISSISEVGLGAMKGDFKPALQMGKEAARGSFNSLKPPSPQLKDGTMTGIRPADPVLQESQRRREQRYQASPEGQRSMRRLEDLDAKASLDPSLTGKAIRGTTELLTGAAPTVAAAIASRGALAPVALTAAAQSANNPGQMGPNAAAATLPIPGVGALGRRLRGKGRVAEPSPLPEPSVGPREPAPVQAVEPAPTGQMPAIGREPAQPGPTRSAELPAELGASIQSRQPLGRLDAELPQGRPPSPTQQPVTEAPPTPVDRQIIDELPELIDEPIGDFGVKENLAPPRQYPGARGPRMLETQMEVLERQAREAGQPVLNPDASLGKLWERTPRDQALFAAAERSPDIDASLGKLSQRPAQQPLFDAAAKSKWQDSVLAYYRANLLTNPAGRALDLGSTVVNQFADAAVRPVAAAVDVFVSKLTGKRSITGASLQDTGKALGSVKQGFKDAGEVLKTGKQALDSGADDALYGSEIRTGLGKVADVPINGVFRVLGSLDAPFRRFGFTRNLADRARVAAINEAKAGRIPRNQVDARAGQLMDRDDIINAAIRDGERSVLSEPNKISSWLSRQTANSPNTRLAIGIVQPFMRIPLNAVLKGADFSGVGGIKALYKVARGVGRKAKGQTFFRDLEEQRVFSQNVASGSFAPAAFLLGMELEDQGKLEGYYYTSKKDFPSGRTPTSINIGGENYDVNRLGGFVLAPLFIGATYSRLRKQDVGQADALLRSFSGLIQQAPALGYYGAPAKAGRILTADEPGEEVVKEAGSITAGFIPASGALGAAAKGVDKNRKRETPGFTGPIVNKIPGLRGTLPEKEKGSRAQISAAYAAKLKEHGIDVGFVKRMKGEPEELYKGRLGRIESWSNRYGEKLVSDPGFSKLTPSQQKSALKSLRENIYTEANDKEPNLELFEAGRIVYAAQQAEGNRTERNKRKYYTEP